MMLLSFVLTMEVIMVQKIDAKIVIETVKKTNNIKKNITRVNGPSGLPKYK